MPFDRPIRISIINFWDKAFKNDFFDYLLTQSTEGGHEYVQDIESADVVISSVFGRISSPQNKTIMYIGENVRPNFARCSFSLSFDTDYYGGRNCYLPLWYSRLAWPGYSYVNHRNDGVTTHGHEELIPINSLLSQRRMPSNFESRKFCTLIAGNPESLRVNLFIALNQYKSVDGFGKMFNNPLLESKFNVMNGYKFSLCPENSFFHGYVTEKLFDAWYGGTIPIWYGPTNSPGGLNRLAFLNYADEYNIESLIQSVISLDNDYDKYCEVFCRPLLTEAPKLSPVVSFLKNSISTLLQ